MKEISITIITVCRNAEKVLEGTIQSVITQTYPNIQYIIVDGASTDGTLDIINKYQASYPISYISEPDQGIYDAMNKGIMMASGDYIEFLNAGDRLYEITTVEDIVRTMSKHKADIYYGNIIYVYGDGHTEIRKYEKWCGRKVYNYTGDCINHQSIFAKCSLLKENKFCLSYKICADREWMMRMKKKKVVFQCIPEIICYYSLDENSTSIRQKKVYAMEADRCVKTYYPFGYLIFRGFEFCRNNKVLSGWLHKIYEILLIKK